MTKYFLTLLFISLGFLTCLKGQTWSVDSLSTPRAYFAITKVGSKMLIIGGNGDNPSSVDIFDEPTKKWTKNKLSFVSTKLKTGVIGNKVFCLQGYDPLTNQPAKNLDIYDASTNIFKRDSLPFEPQDIGVGTIGSKLFVAGGSDVTPTSVNTLNIVRIYDTLTQKWTYSTPLSAARRDIEVIKVKNKLLFIGGYTENPRTAWDWTFYKNIDIYDETTNKWSTVYMKTGRVAPSVTVSGSKVLIVGGIDRLGFVAATPTLFFTKTVEIYDVDMDTWQVADLPQPRLVQSIATYDKKAYLISGEKQDETNANRTLYDKIDVYDFVTNKWTNIPFPSANHLRSGGMSINLSNKIYFVGGSLPDFQPTKRIDILTLPLSSLFDVTVLSNRLTTFPNPVSDILTVDFDKGDIKNYSIKIANTLGQTVYFQDGFDENLNKIDVKKLNQGLYFLTIHTSKGLKTQTFFKQ
jgi:N-acetylneuraminic acid mutarotase